MSDVNALNLSYMAALAFGGAQRGLRWECARECVCVRIMNLINLKLSVIIIIKWPVCTMEKKNIALYYDITPLYLSLVLFKPHMMKCQYVALKGASCSEAV